MGGLLGNLADKAKGAGDAVEGVGKTVLGIGLHPVDTISSAAGSKVREAIEDKSNEFLWDLAQSVVDGTQMVFHLIIEMLLSFTQPQITGDFIYTMGGRLFFLSLPLIVLFASARIIVDSIRARAFAGAEGAFFGAAGSVLGTIALLPLTNLAVRAVDAAADGLLKATLSDGDKFVDDVVGSIVKFGTAVGNMTAGKPVSGPVAAWAVPADGVLVTVIICLLCASVLLASCVVVGLALVARNMLLYLVIVSGPVCLSGLAWEPTRRWASIWLGWMVALIFTKLGIAIALGLGVLAITSPGETQSQASVLPLLATVLAGLMMMIMAMFMPMACFMIFGFLGEAGVRELSMSAMAAQGALTTAAAGAAGAPQSAIDRVSSLLKDSDQGGGGLVSVGAPGGGPDSGLNPGTGDSGGGGEGDSSGTMGGVVGGLVGGPAGAEAGAEVSTSVDPDGRLDDAGMAGGKSVAEDAKETVTPDGAGLPGSAGENGSTGGGVDGSGDGIPDVGTDAPSGVVGGGVPLTNEVPPPDEPAPNDVPPPDPMEPLPPAEPVDMSPVDQGPGSGEEQ